MFSESMSRTKIIATIGPASADYDKIYAMVREGVSGFRINFSHGDVKEWSLYVKIIREVEEKTDKRLAIIGDLKGPSIRVGELEKPITLNRGDEIPLILAEKVDVKEKAIPLPVKRVFDVIREGDIVLMNDGKVRFFVEQTLGDTVKLKALTNGIISSRKALVIQGKDVALPVLSEKDLRDLRFAVDHDIDYIGLSYVRSPDDVKVLRCTLEDLGAKNVGVISKIETRSAIEHLKDIIKLSDITLIARGDLGMHFPLENIPKLQSMIISEALKSGVHVILATQILSSMIENIVPTRSEIVDVVNAVSEGVDALMLTGETAIGKHPVEAVKWLRRVLDVYEPITKPKRVMPSEDSSEMERFTYGVVVLADTLKAKIGVYTRSGYTASQIARYRPLQELYASSPYIKTLRKLAIIWGVETVKVKSEDYDEGVDETYVKLLESGEISYGDLLILTCGLIEEKTHIIKIVRASPTAYKGSS